jgi:cell division septum initiation protein DivIVA
MIPAALLSPRVIGPVVLAAVIFGSGWLTRGHFAKASIAKLEVAHAQAIASAEKKAREAVERARAREAELTEQTRVIVDEARKAIQTLETSIGSADTASRGMLDAARRAASRCPSNPNPATTGGSPSAILSGSRDDGERLMRLVTELDGFAGAAAQDADRSRAARFACQRAYEAAMTAINN